MSTEQHGLRVGRARTIDCALRPPPARTSAVPVPWEPPMPDFDPSLVDARLVAEAVASRIRSVVPALESVRLEGIAGEMKRIVGALDCVARLEAAGASGSAVWSIDRSCAR